MTMKGKQIIHNFSLMNKMLMLNIIGITSAMIVVLVFVSLFYSYYARESLSNNMLSQAELFSTNIAPMLAFHDIEEAEKLATKFHEIEELERIAVLASDGKNLIDLQSFKIDYLPMELSGNIPHLSTGIKRVGINNIIVFSPIKVEDEIIGTVVFENSAVSIRKNIFLLLSIAVIATFVGVTLSAVILRKLQMVALGPIINLSDLAEKIAEDKNYALRVQVVGKDEVARLAMRFNQMLDKIECWNNDLNQEIVKRKKSEKQLDFLARTDELTQLPNRLSFTSDLKKSVENAKAKKRKVGLMFVDLDDFKIVNDIYGHQYGDTTLKVTAKRMRQVLKKSDLLYRLGGDEFAVIINDIKDIAQVDSVCMRIIDKVSESITFQKKEKAFSVKVGASIGLAFYPVHAQTTHDLLHHADLAMYGAKKCGKNAYMMFCKDLIQDK